MEETIVVRRADWELLTAALKQLVAGITVTDCYKHIPDAYLKQARQVLAETGSQEQDVCRAVIHHGPGHQSKTTCQRVGPHEGHKAHVGGRVLRWNGNDASTGFFDESPE